MLRRRVAVHPLVRGRLDGREDKELGGVQLALVDQDAAEAVEGRGSSGSIDSVSKYRCSAWVSSGSVGARPAWMASQWRTR